MPSESQANASFDPLVDQQPGRYVVGIDLGTTNSAVAYVDTQRRQTSVELFAVEQVVAPGQVEARDTLPSFHYQAVAAEVDSGGLRLSWSDSPPDAAVGVWAREQATKAPGRVITSAKSWLCHTGVDRTAELLPWQGAGDVSRLSPVAVSARYLQHIRQSWDEAHPDDPLAEQDVVITLPASFDEVARELTIEAARLAGLPRVVLIEEPQAAFYAWVDKHAESWQQQVSPGQKILVCDIGGGTSDFTLIRVRQASQQAAGDVQFHRIAVGEHLILGGDNLDLALAHHIEQKITPGGKLAPGQWDVLVRSARRVKETLLAFDAPEQTTVNLPGAGTKLIGGGLQCEVTRAEVEQLLVEGFLPLVPLDAQPETRRSGFQEFGLPFAPDAGITRYLAAFLSAHRHTGLDETATVEHDPARPDVVLFNGGFFAAGLLRQRLLATIGNWFSADDEAWQPQVLDNERLDLAVARGAAYYGMVRRGHGVRISANLARSYYVGVDHDPPAAVCLVPGNAEPGEDIELVDREFQLTIAQPVEFPLYVSSTRLVDQAGDVVEIDREQMTPLPPIRTVIRPGSRKESGAITVRLHAHLTEIGTMELSCHDVERNRSWQLQFDIRSATQTDVAAHESAAEAEGFVDETAWSKAREQIAAVFSAEGEEKPSKLMRRLAQALEMDKSHWPTSLLRRMWSELFEWEPGRRRSASHEARWINLAGYALRPGYGFALDDWRVAETWRTIRGKLAYPGSQNELFVLWRRVAGGLSRGQQLAIAESLLAEIRALHRRFSGGKARPGDPAMNPTESVEVWRLLGSLELIDVPDKLDLGRMIVDLLPKRKLAKVRDAMLWSLGRLGQRMPVYGPLNTVVDAQTAGQWLEALMRLDRGEPVDLLAAMQLARRTGDRHRDLPDALRRETLDWLADHGASEHLMNLVRDGGQLDEQEQNQVFGESLPVGLRLQ